MQFDDKNSFKYFFSSSRFKPQLFEIHIIQIFV